MRRWQFIFSSPLTPLLGHHNHSCPEWNTCWATNLSTSMLSLVNLETLESTSCSILEHGIHRTPQLVWKYLWLLALQLSIWTLYCHTIPYHKWWIQYFIRVLKTSENFQFASLWNNLYLHRHAKTAGPNSFLILLKVHLKLSHQRVLIEKQNPNNLIVRP